jgi:ribose 5-phosphate isomerase A
MKEALALIGDARVVGLGTGRAAERFIYALAAQRPGMTCVATSEATLALAAQLGLRVVPLQKIDVTFDGADEVDPALNLIKGYGGALLREKIVARASQRVVIMVGEEKRVRVLGERGRLPIEVIPFAVPLVSEALAKHAPVLRQAGAGAFVTDNGNHILDCTPPVPLTPAFDEACLAIPGVMATGAFFDLATTVLVQRQSGVETLNGSHS